MKPIDTDYLFEHSPDAIFVEDYEGNVLDVNPAACRLHALGRSELIGKNVVDLVPPEQREKVRANFKKWVTGEITEYAGFSYTSDGRSIPVDVRVSHMTHDGKPVMVFIARDVSDREAYREAMEDSEKRFREIVEHAPDALLLLDVESGKLVEVNHNAERLFGMNREALLTCGIAQLSPATQPNGRDSATYVCELIEATGFEHPVCFEWDHLQASGKIVTCEVRLLKLESGGRVMVRGSLTNITKQKQAQKRVEDLQLELERARRIETAGLLAGGVAHDLNNILGPMVGYPDLLLDELPEASDMRYSVQEIKSSAERAASMIQDLLILSRRGDIQTSPQDLSQIIAEYLNSIEFKRLHEHRPKVKVVFKAGQELPMIEGSRAHLLRLIMNLVINAMQAMSDDGRVTVSLRKRHLDTRFVGYEGIPEGEYLVFEVRDDGHGIAADKLEHIFEPFFFSSKKKGGSNSGLGLAVVHGVIRDHGAYIDIESSLDGGTAFKIHFPALEDAVAIAEEEALILQASGHALVVDDVPEQRELATQLLGRLGMSVTCVENGRRALELVEEDNFDVVLLDMSMGDELDGLDTYRLIQQRHPALPCIIASGYAETARLKEVLALGAGPHLKKPYSLARLSTTLQQIVGGVHV